MIGKPRADILCFLNSKRNCFNLLGAMVQILFWVSLLELISCPAVAKLGTSDRAPGKLTGVNQKNLLYSFLYMN